MLELSSNEDSVLFAFFSLRVGSGFALFLKCCHFSARFIATVWCPSGSMAKIIVHVLLLDTNLIRVVQ